jgi:hypothetical protein
LNCWRHNEYHLELLPSPQLSPKTTHFTSIDPGGIDTGLAKDWLRYCDELHADCRPVSSRPHPVDIILIDVQDHCLVQFPVAPRYLALSYVWGSLPDPFETRMANFATLQVPNALRSDEFAGRLPQTIRDAIKVTRELGERYLWVDRHCIIQDDEASKAHQVDSMASIYANAHLTLIAADGADADAGLQGVGVARLYPPPPVLKLGPGCSVRAAPETEVEGNLMPWHYRAWTFQERLFSRRVLTFFRGSVIWQCMTSIWAEGVAAEPQGIPRDESWHADDTRLDFMQVPFDKLFVLPFELPLRPYFPQYEKWVLAYSSRELTYQTDGLRAFSGVLQVLSETYEGGFLHGLPVMFFDLAMLWEPLWGAVLRTVGPGNHALLFPSWSWAAWDGYIINELADDVSSDPALIIVYPLVRWYNVKSTGETIWVNQTSHLAHEMREHEGTRDMTLDPSSMTPHNDMSKIEVPKGDWDRYIHGSVQQALFHLEPHKRLGSRLKEDPRYFVEYLITGRASNEIVGCLKVPSVSYDPAWEGGAKSCRCIVISGGKAGGPDPEELRSIYFPECALIKETKEQREYEFYNVLWVEEGRDGIAYRRGIGRVWKEGWHRQEVETRDIILG